MFTGLGLAAWIVGLAALYLAYRIACALPDARATLDAVSDVDRDDGGM